jgi:hypothetical protein
MRKKTPRSDLFWSHVDVKGVNECWEWKGSLTNGYGGFQGQRAHRVAWELTHGVRPELCVCHVCDNRKCVNPGHLFLGTRADNNRDKISKGRQSRGSQTGNARLTEEQVASVRRMRSGGRRLKEIASAFGVTKQTISRVCRGEMWRHVEVKVSNSRPSFSLGEGHPRSRLTESDVIDIRTLRSFGARGTDLCAQFNVSWGAIQKVLNRTTWRHVA